ncbi:MAG TPA: APC family permease [Solirubrobacteraceae bacterium]|nr:APC family permease [Solirubrobacteraceae bacterium]
MAPQIHRPINFSEASLMEERQATAMTSSVSAPGALVDRAPTAVASGFYTRKASGLVREISPNSAFWMNMTYASIPLSVLAFTLAPSAFPGVNLFWSVIIISLLSLIPVIVYGVLAATMPRSGGDYVWQSRILHPAIGFASNFNFTIQALFVGGGIVSTWIAGFAGSSALLTLGTVLHSNTLVRLSVHASQRGWELAVALLFICLFGIASALGTKITMRLMIWLYAVCMLGQLLLIAILALTDHGSFVHSFNQYASYSKVIALGHSAGGFTAHPASTAPTLAAMPLIYSGIGFAMVSTYCSGEIKSVKKSSLYSTCGAVLATGVVLALLALLAQNVFTLNFLGSITALSSTKAYPLSSQPFFYLFASMTTSSSVLIVLISVAFEAGVIAGLPALFMIATRNIFAWSFDRVMPSILADVSPRTGAPVNASILTAAVMGVSATCYLFVPIKWTAFIAGAETMGLITFAIVGLCALILPWRRPDIWNLSPYRWMIGRIPVISVLGLATFAIEAWLIYYLLTNKALGANSAATLRLLPSLLVIGLLWFGGAALFARRGGMSLVSGQKELPPE